MCRKPKSTTSSKCARRVTLLIALICVGVSIVANAKREDARQPITIEADKAKVDEKQGLSTYTGNVLLRQGSIQIKSDELEVYSKDGGLDKLVAKGKPVIYLQSGDAEKGDIVGEAYKMEYFASEGKLILLDNAKLSQGQNMFSGNRIAYDTQQEIVSAAVSATGTQRVQVTIQPKQPKPEDQ